jgi:hypothetical protein
MSKSIDKASESKYTLLLLDDAMDDDILMLPIFD